MPQILILYNPKHMLSIDVAFVVNIIFILLINLLSVEHLKISNRIRNSVASIYFYFFILTLLFKYI